MNAWLPDFINYPTDSLLNLIDWLPDWLLQGCEKKRRLREKHKKDEEKDKQIWYHKFYVGHSHMITDQTVFLALKFAKTMKLITTE